MTEHADWLAVGASVRGASHVRTNQENEDRLCVGVNGDWWIVAVADGHGSDKCTRAGTGAGFAAEVGFSVMASSSAIPLDQVAAQIVRTWRQRVDEDLERHPPSDAEIGAAPHPHYLLYGTTLICAAISNARLRLFQIGDGDIVLGDRESDRAGLPIEARPPTRPGETESLCQQNAEDRAKVVDIDRDERRVDAVMVASDGLSTAFADPSWHDETMRDLLKRAEGLSADELETALESWCAAPAEVGGDDTTIAVLLRV